ncbi:unnamed protein product [Alternaria alternata]
MTASSNPNDVLSMILVMGVTGAGKSYFINQLARSKVVEEGDSLDSCTQSCQLVPVQLGQSKVLLLDTPGFDDTTRPDSEILGEIAKVLTAQYKLGVQLKGVLYIHRITDIRFNRSSVKTFEILKGVVGPDALQNVLLVTSRWDGVTQATGSDRERQLREKFWAYMLGRGSNMSRFLGDRDSAIALTGQLLCKDVVVLELQKEIVHQKKRLDQTAAGSLVNDNLDALKAQYEKELASLERLKQELLESDRVMKRQIQKDWENEQARLRKVRDEQVALQRPVNQEVDQQIARKKSGMSRILPFVPVAVSILASMVGIPPGLTGLLTSWFTDAGANFDFGSISDLLAF